GGAAGGCAALRRRSPPLSDQARHRRRFPLTKPTRAGRGIPSARRAAAPPLADPSRPCFVRCHGERICMNKLRELDAALAEIADASMLAIPADYAGVAMAATRALIRRGAKSLHLVTLPASSLQADLLIGAG